MSEKQSTVQGSPLRTMVLATVIIGSPKSEDFKLALLSTAAGNFSVTSNENPELVSTISKLREGDALSMEVLSPFAVVTRNNPQTNEPIHDAACTKFRILEAEAGVEIKTKGLENRLEKKAIVKKATGPVTGAGSELAEKPGSEEERG